MSYRARVFRVFIASPNDVQAERKIIREAIARWNAVHSKEKNIVLLPVGYDTDAAPEIGRNPQTYINNDVLADCDFLIAVFWSKLGSPILNEKCGTISEIKYHTRQNKPAMLYFSDKDLPSDVDIEQLRTLQEYRKEIRESKTVYYNTYKDLHEFESQVYTHIEMYVNSGGLKSSTDSDIISCLNDDYKMAEEVKKHFPLVAKNVYMKIYHEKHENFVWDAIIAKLKKSPADLRDALIFISNNGGFKNPGYEKGYKELAKISQSDFSSFLMNLYAVNRNEFDFVYDQELLEDSPFKHTLVRIIERDEKIDKKTM